jgi:hypothetical protein
LAKKIAYDEGEFYGKKSLLAYHAAGSVKLIIGSASLELASMNRILDNRRSLSASLTP